QSAGPVALRAVTDRARAGIGRASGTERARVVGDRIRRVAAEHPRYDRHRGVSVDALERQVLSVSERQREGEDENEDERRHGTPRGHEKRPALAQPARKYASRVTMDARA